MKYEKGITLNFSSPSDFLDYLIDNPSEIEKCPDSSAIRFDENGKLILIPADENGNPIIIPAKKRKKSFLKAACL
jgi:hypothetical protein